MAILILDYQKSFEKMTEICQRIDPLANPHDVVDIFYDVVTMHLCEEGGEIMNLVHDMSGQLVDDMVPGNSYGKVMDATVDLINLLSFQSTAAMGPHIQFKRDRFAIQPDKSSPSRVVISTDLI